MTTLVISSTQVEQIHRLVSDAVEQGEFSGSVLITQGGATLLEESHGFAHRGFAIPNSAAMRYDVASITKLFTAVAVLQLVEQGRLDLDARIVDLIDLTGTRIGPDVTLRHLLTHSSGIADDADEVAGEDYEDLFIDTPNYRFRQTGDQLPHFVHKAPLFAPGEDARYNNAGFLLAGLALEAVSGLTYHDYVRQHVFERAGMNESDFLALDGINPNLAEHYKRIDDDGEVTWRKNIYAYPPVGDPAGGANVTARDLERFLRSLQAGRLLGPELTTAMLTPQVKSHTLRDGSESWFSYATQIRTDPNGSILDWGKDGQNTGVAANAVVLPDLNVAVILLANIDCNVWTLARDIDRILRKPDASA
jgi:CubicO group peptidase (beta-lactamase class C family)